MKRFLIIVQNWIIIRKFNKFFYQRFSEKVIVNSNCLSKRCLEEQFYTEVTEQYKKILTSKMDIKREICLIESNLNSLYVRSNDPSITIGAVLFSFLGVALVFFKDIFKDIGIGNEGYLNLLFIFVVFIILLFTFIFHSLNNHDYYCNKLYYYELSLRVVKSLEEKFEDNVYGENEINFNSKHIQLFDEFQQSKYKMKEYLEFKILYHHIMDFYAKKISSGKIDIKIEKLVLESKLGKYEGENLKFNSSLFVGISCALATLYIQSLVEVTAENRALFMLVFIIVAFSVIFTLSKRNITKNKDKDNVYNVSVKVLEYIEKNLDLKNETNEIIEEVASAIEYSNKNVKDSNSKNKSNSSL